MKPVACITVHVVLPFVAIFNQLAHTRLTAEHSSTKNAAKEISHVAVAIETARLLKVY